MNKLKNIFLWIKKNPLSIVFYLVLIGAVAYGVVMETKDPYSLFDTAEIYYEKEDYQHAFEYYNKAIENGEHLTDNEKATLYNNRGVCLHIFGNSEEALKNYNISLEFKPNDLITLDNKKQVLFDIGGRDQEVLDTIDYMLKNFSEFKNDDVTYSDRGFVLYNLYRYDEALVDFEKSLELNPENIQALYGRGRIASDFDDCETALPYYEHVIQINPDYSYVKDDYAFCLGYLGYYEDALDVLDQLLAEEPENSDAMINYAYDLIMMDKYDQAHKYLDQAQKLNPNDYYAYLYRSWIYGLEGNLELVVENLEKAFAIDSSHKEIVYNDECFDSIRDKEEFKKLFEENF